MAKITECERQKIKVNKKSITIINPDTGKTAGVITGLKHIQDIPKNKQFDFFTLLKKSGVWANPYYSTDNIFIDDKNNTVYALNNLKTHEFYEKCPFLKKEKPYFEQEKAVNNLRNNGVTIINTYICN
nr:MAG TPA: hypothetical protein [Caudoviricetes sp.]